jgi:hypothetical protein
MAIVDFVMTDRGGLRWKDHQIHTNGSDWYILGWSADLNTFAMFKTSSKGIPNATNGGTPWKIADPNRSPISHTPFISYSISAPVTVQVGTTIHVFYTQYWSTLSDYSILYITFDMTTDTWGTPDTSGPFADGTAYPGAAEELSTRAVVALGANDFLVAYRWDKQTGPGPGPPRTAEIRFARRTAGVWGAPFTAVTTTTGGETYLVSDEICLFNESGTDLVHLYWYQNGGPLYPGPNTTEHQFRAKSYSLSGGTFGTEQTIVSGISRVPPTGTTVFNSLLYPTTLSFSGEVIVPFKMTQETGNPVSSEVAYTIQGDYTSVNPTYSLKVINPNFYGYLTPPVAVVNNSGTLCVLSGTYTPDFLGPSGFTPGPPRQFLHRYTAGVWGAEETFYAYASGAGEYPPLTTNAALSPILWQYSGPELGGLATEIHHPFYPADFIRNLQNIAVISDTGATFGVAAVAGVNWADEIQGDETPVTYTLIEDPGSGGPCPDVTINIAGCPVDIDGTDYDPGDTVTITAGDTITVSPVSCPPYPPDPEIPPDADPPFPPTYPYPFITYDIYGRENLALNLKMVRGDTFKFNAQIILNGAPVDLTGGTIRMTAKWSTSDEDINAVFQLSSPASGIVVTSAPTGEIAVTIASALTSPLPPKKVELPYDIQFVNSIGEVFTVLYGTLVIVSDVTVTA